MKAALFLLILLISSSVFSKVIEIRDVSYGPHERNKLDFARLDNGKKLPLVILIHGGGFKGGGKEHYRAKPITKKLITSGFAVMPISYPYLEHMPLQDIMKSASRAIQFVRRHADHELVNIDKNKIFIQGGSAGGGIALWLNAHDDLSDINSADPVSRESTKPQGIIHNNSQYSYNFLDWVNTIGKPITDHFSKDDISLYYGDCSYEDLTNDPDCISITKTLDMTSHLDSTDSPMLIVDTNGSNGSLLKRSYYVHNPRHGSKIHKTAKEVGLKSKTLFLEKPDPNRVNRVIINTLKRWLKHNS